MATVGLGVEGIIQVVGARRGWHETNRVVLCVGDEEIAASLGYAVESSGDMGQARSMLRGIRVASKQELIDRIHQYFEQINADPVIFRWKYKMDEISMG